MFQTNDKIKALAGALGFRFFYKDYQWFVEPDGNSFRDELERMDGKLRAIVGVLVELRGLSFKRRPEGTYTILCQEGNYDRVEEKLKALEELVRVDNENT